MRLTELIVVLMELAARLLWDGARGRVARWATGLLPDLPWLGGAWVASFNEPDSNSATRIAVDARLRQFGRHITGVGHVQGTPADTFRFEGRIKRNVLYGSFARSDSHVLAGTGTFVLKVRADSKRLDGHCMWYDGDLDGVWDSPYEWRR